MVFIEGIWLRATLRYLKPRRPPRYEPPNESCQYRLPYNASVWFGFSVLSLVFRVATPGCAVQCCAAVVLKVLNFFTQLKVSILQ